MSQTKVEAPFVEGGGGSNFKNLMINGDMRIAQRATSVSSHSADTYVNIDRWKTRVYNQGVFTVSQSTTVPAGEGFASSQKWDCTTADGSPAASDFLIYEQKMEGQNLQHLEYGTSSAKKLTVSFHVRSNKTGAYTIGLYSADGSRHIESSYTISSADTWEKKIVTFAGDTGGTINDDNGEGMKLWFWLGAGSNFSSGTHATSWAAYAQANVLVDNQVNMADSTDNEWYITGVQLEVGDDASDFENIPFDVQFNRCCRYYWKPVQGNVSTNEYVALGDFYSSTQVDIDFRHITPMRTQPTVEQGSGTDYFKYYYGNTANGTVDGAWTYWIGNEHISSLYATASDAVGTSNGGKACRVLASTEASAYIALNAEL
jgi:hypothetical protein